MDIGLTGTEEMYAAVTKFGACGGIEVGFHNPIDYNGMKIVGLGSRPLSDQEFSAIKELAEGSNFIKPQKQGIVFNSKEVPVHPTSKKF